MVHIQPDSSAAEFSEQHFLGSLTQRRARAFPHVAQVEPGSGSGLRVYDTVVLRT